LTLISYDLVAVVLKSKAPRFIIVGKIAMDFPQARKRIGRLPLLHRVSRSIKGRKTVRLISIVNYLSGSDLNRCGAIKDAKVPILAERVQMLWYLTIHSQNNFLNS